MQNIISFDRDYVQQFIESIRPRLLLPQQFLPQVRNDIPYPPVLAQKQPCDCPEQHAIRNQNNNSNSPQRPRMNTQPQPEQRFATKMDQEIHHNNENTNNNNEQMQPQTTNHNPQKVKELLTTNVLPILSAQNPNTNIIYSPLSLEILLTFVTLGARGITAQELYRTLQLPANEQQIISVAKNKLQRSYNTNGAQVVMANKMYYANYLVPENNISRAANHLQMEYEPTDFKAPAQASNNINSWVARKTNNRIQNLVSPSTLDEQTESILLNAIYFKGKWEYPFSTSDTERKDFHNSDGQTVPVDMMFTEEVFRYGEFPNIGARVIEIPYNESDLSMMIILPDNTNGLLNVERYMSNMDLEQISQRLEERTVNVRLPRFRFESELDMVSPLKQVNRFFIIIDRIIKLK